MDAGLATILTTVTLNVEKSFAFNIGVRTGSTVTPLTLDGGTLNMPRSTGSGSESGSQQIMVAFGSTAATVNVEDSNPDGAVLSLPTVQVTGTALTLNFTGGNLGLAVNPGEVATVAAGSMTKGGGATPQLYVGEGATLTDFIATTGKIYDRSNNTRAALRVAGDATWEIAITSTGATTTMTIDGSGKVIDNGSGNIATLNVEGGYDASGNPHAKTVTNSVFERGYNVNLDNGDPNAFTFTNATQFPDGIGAGTLRTPQGVKALIDNI